MASYLLDGICAKTKYLVLGWKWNFSNDIPLVHIYYKLISEEGYRGEYTRITKQFISVIYQSEPPFMFKRERSSFPNLVYWFTPTNGTYT